MAFFLQYRAVAQCDWETRDGSYGCVVTEEFKCDIDGTGKSPRIVEEVAEAAARKYFIDAGWDLSEGNFRCPQCKGRSPDMCHWEDEDEDVQCEN